MTSTDAYKNLESNLQEVIAMLKLLMPTELKRSVVKVSKKLDRQLKRNTLLDAKFRIRLLPELESVASAAQDYVRGRTLLQDWISAVLVTIVLTYLEDGLVLIATKNPLLLKRADSPGIDRILHATSMDDLRAELRKQWANKTLLGGPKEWLSLLQRLGAKPYKRESEFRLQHLWDTRNLIVHGKGLATAAYLAKQGKPTVAPGARIHVSTALVKWWIEGIGEFADATDPFFQNYGANNAKGAND